MKNFTDCIRSRDTGCGIQRAWEEAVTIAVSVESYRREKKVRWDPVKEEIVYRGGFESAKPRQIPSGLACAEIGPLPDVYNCDKQVFI